MFNVINRKITRSCVNNYRNWVRNPAYAEIHPDHKCCGMNMPMVLGFGEKIVLCGGEIRPKNKSTNYIRKVHHPVSCYSWQGREKKMHFFVNLSIPRSDGEVVHMDDDSFAIIGGDVPGETERSNMYDIYRDSKFTLKRSDLPEEVRKPCIASVTGIEYAYLVAVSLKEGIPFFAEIERKTLKSQLLPPPPKYSPIAFTCSLLCLKDHTPVVVLMSVAKTNGQSLLMQVFNTYIGKWTVFTDLKFPDNYSSQKKNAGFQPFVHKSKLFLLLDKWNSTYLMDIESMPVIQSGKDNFSLGKIWLSTQSKPVLTSKEIGESICTDKKGQKKKKGNHQNGKKKQGKKIKKIKKRSAKLNS